eukprot:768348-Hanusia_phi.AAC.2
MRQDHQGMRKDKGNRKEGERRGKGGGGQRALRCIYLPQIISTLRGSRSRKDENRRKRRRVRHQSLNLLYLLQDGLEMIRARYACR